MSLLVCNETRCELEHGEVVGRDALPADEQSSKPIVPAVGAFDDPASRPTADTADQGFLSAPTNVGSDSSLAHCGFRIGVVVALVQAQIVWPPRTARCLQDDSVERSGHHPLVVDVGAGDHHRQRDTTTIRQNVPFHPEFRAVRRIRTCVAPPLGALLMALSSDAKSHLMPRRLS